MREPGITTYVERGLCGLREGRDQARDDLIRVAQERLFLLSRKMLRRFPEVQRWEATDDILQRALWRLHQSLVSVHPESARHFFNLAATQIRRTLIELARHHSGKESFAANHHTDPASPSHTPPALDGLADDLEEEPETLDAWVAFHEGVERLPDEEREVVNLLWYKGLSHAEAAEQLGVSVKTVQRRWVSARLRMLEFLDGEVFPHR